MTLLPFNLQIAVSCRVLERSTSLCTLKHLTFPLMQLQSVFDGEIRSLLAMSDVNMFIAVDQN